ncbi:MAG: type II toxin-antitoxin system VapC family toxin [Anaerolineae bacterium]|nr:type II toxin-antitoxin system VapC family toxin [Anaerolineae bacterium]
MNSAVYLFDTNIISALRPDQNLALFNRIQENATQTLCLCEPVIFEVERGYEHRQAYQQLTHFRANLMPLFMVISVQLADWRVAAKIWGSERRQGRQFSDVDVLLAAMTLRLNGILVTADSDFSALPFVRTENWLIDT